MTLFRYPNWELVFLSGGRYADLKERLLIQNTTTDLIFNNTEILNDSFVTRNQFIGSQFGTRLFVTWDHFTFDLITKITSRRDARRGRHHRRHQPDRANPLIPPGIGTSRAGFLGRSRQTSAIGRRIGSPSCRRWS